MNPIPLPADLECFVRPVFDRKPLSVTAIDVKELTSYTDMVLIVEAGSPRQTTALAEHVLERLKKDQKIMPLGVEGIKEGSWALMDFGHVIVHVFESETKALYDLEGLWSDAPLLDLSGFHEGSRVSEEKDAHV